LAEQTNCTSGEDEPMSVDEGVLRSPALSQNDRERQTDAKREHRYEPGEDAGADIRGRTPIELERARLRHQRLSSSQTRTTPELAEIEQRLVGIADDSSLPSRGQGKHARADVETAVADHRVVEPDVFVWCISGPHVDEGLDEIVARKCVDIATFGWCLWAYGGGGACAPDRVQGLVTEHAALTSPLAVMPNTGKASPVGHAFSMYSATKDGSTQSLPDGMSPVTGGGRSWALVLHSLRVAPETQIDLGAYDALTTTGLTPLRQYLRGSHGRACAIRSKENRPEALRMVDVVGELVAPYSVYLIE
jgi:hypothetical protein